MYCQNCGNEYFENGICTVCGQPAPVNTEEQNYYGEEQFDADNAPAETPDAGKGLGIGSLACGLFSFIGGSVCTCLASMLGGFLPAIAAVVAIVLGIIAITKSKASGNKNVLGIIGIVLGALSVGVIIVLIIVNMIAGGIMGAAMASGGYYY